jgi:hypothetical protein
MGQNPLDMTYYESLCIFYNISRAAYHLSSACGDDVEGERYLLSRETSDITFLRAE